MDVEHDLTFNSMKSKPTNYDFKFFYALKGKVEQQE